MSPLMVYQQAVTHTFDILLRFGVLPCVCLWAFVRTVKEVAREIRAFRYSRGASSREVRFYDW